MKPPIRLDRKKKKKKNWGKKLGKKLITRIQNTIILKTQ